MGVQDHIEDKSLPAPDSETISGGNDGGRGSSAALLTESEGVRALLAENIGDYMSLGFFAHLLNVSSLANVSDVRGQCLRYLDHMLGEEYLLVGTVRGNDFVPWVLGAAQLLEAVSGQWPQGASADYETLRDIAWLSNTAKGDDAARQYLQNRAPSYRDRFPPPAGGLQSAEYLQSGDRHRVYRCTPQ